MIQQFRSATLADLPSIQDLLERCQLPVAGVGDHGPDFIVSQSGDDLIAVAGLECYDPAPHVKM